MLRRLLNLLAAMSLVLCVAVVAVAVRGRFASGGATFGPQNGRISWRFTWRDGNLYTYYCPGSIRQFSLGGPAGSVAGVRWARGRSPEGLPIVSATMPQPHVWGAAVLLAVAPRAAPAHSARRLPRLRLRPPRHAEQVPGMWQCRLCQHNGMKRACSTS